MRKFIVLLTFVLHLTNSLAQINSISLHYKSISFKDVIREIKNQTDLTFFYCPEWVDSSFVSIDADNKPIDFILQQIAGETKLNYILNNKNVIFSKVNYIKTNFKDEYLSYKLEQQIAKDTVRYSLPKPVEEKTNNINLEYKLIKIGNASASPNNPNATLHGYIRDIETGEPLIGVVIYFEQLKRGDASNVNGFYSVTIPRGQYKIEFRNIGLKTTYRNVDIQSDGQLNVEMKIQLTALKEVLVTAKSEDKMRNLKMGVEKITFKTIMQLPTGLGEPDLIKSTLLLPGVQSVGEAANGFNVRGGSTDQNLFLLNGASIINTSHFFGFFSGFNSDMIKDITLYKSSIPANYGGRLSSIMDITLKDGSRKEIKTSGAIGPVSGRLTVEGPIIKDKSSFIVSTRTTYSDWVLKMLDDKQLKNSKAGFYDLQGNFSYELDKLNSFYLSGYYSHDNFDYYQEDAFKYNTLASTAKWKHIFNPKLFSTFSGIISNYDYTLDSRQNPYSLYSLKYKLDQYNVKADFNYYPTIKNKIDFGFSSILYGLSPGDRRPLNDSSLISSKKLDRERALESALYLNYEFEVSPVLSISAGLRYSIYTMLGPKEKFIYAQNQPKNISTITDTTYYTPGQVVQFYSGPEPRISANLSLPWNTSLKIGYNRMYQYIHMISNTTTMSPTDVWMLSDSYIRPQRGDQISIGIYKNLRSNTIETSVETYYKNIVNLIDYKGGAQLLMNEHLETDVLSGNGKAYGIEFMLEKKSGRLTGWVSYTYSRILDKIDGLFDEEKVNNGDYFPADYDKPHNLKFVANYKISRRINFSSNFLYTTGRPYTMYLTLYDFKDAPLVFYSERNAYRMDDYIRLDLAATINGNLKVKKLNHSSWTFSLYNVFGRENPYSIYFKIVNQKVTGYKLSIFGRPIFTATYNFRIFGNAKDDF
jgi:CarboxypepD_reg-like domain/TonB-dependent Receptor Plug Domain